MIPMCCFVSLLKLDVSLCSVVHTTKYDDLSSTFWKFVQNEASELSEKLHFTNDMNDMLFSNDFIDESRSMEIHERLSEAKWTNLDTYKLLMAVLPKSDNATYMRFCCLLHVKSNLPVMGKILCDECKPFQKCTMNQNVKFSIYASCQAILNNSAIRSVYIAVPIDVDYVDESETEKPVVVHPSSFVCINNKVSATLHVSVEEKYIDKEHLQTKIAYILRVDVHEVQLTVSITNSTWMFLRLSAQAGLRLMQTLSAQESKHFFGPMIAEAFHSESARNVSIELKLSNLPSHTFYIIPTGIFRVKSEDVHLITTDGTSFFGYVFCHVIN